MIREATPADAAACATIYAPYVTNSVISFETRPPIPSQLLRRMRAAHLWLVAEDDGEIYGYAYGALHRERDAYRWAADVAIYLEGRHHGRGLGRALYSRLFDGLRDRGVCVLCAGVALPNPASEALHRTMGFAEVGVYRRIAFKLGQWIDTRWYQLDLQPHSQPPPQHPALGCDDDARERRLVAELEHIRRHNPTLAVAAARAADAIRAQTGWRWVGIYTLDGQRVKNEAWSGPQPPAHPMFRATHGLTASALRTRRTVYCEDVTADSRYLANQATTGSEMIVPILHGDAVVGTLDIESDCRYAFTDTDRDLAEKLATHLTALWAPYPAGHP